MINRYSRPEMAQIWTLRSKFDAWLKVELAGVKAWNKLGLISDNDCKKICKNAKYDLTRIEDIEKETKHDVIAFLTSVNESLGNESRWIHYGLTSSDCIDTALSLRIGESLSIIVKDLKNLLKTLEKIAIEHKFTSMVGRSHGIHGEPTTFGLVVLNWYSDIKRALKNIKIAKEELNIGMFSGAMGNIAHSPIEFEEIACSELGLKCDLISTQVISRDRHANLVNSLAILSSSCEKIAVNIRHLQRTEVAEVQENFASNQKGSSAMPHKRNPILSENITGLCRIIRSYTNPMMENIALWHERDMSHSSVERFIFPDLFINVNFMVNRLSDIISGLKVQQINMKKNLNLTGGLIFSQRILLELPKNGMSREDAYKVVQENTMKTWSDIEKNKKDLDSNNESIFYNYLINDKRINKILSKDTIKSCFSYDYYNKNVESIFERVLK